MLQLTRRSCSRSMKRKKADDYRSREADCSHFGFQHYNTGAANYKSTAPV